MALNVGERNYSGDKKSSTRDSEKHIPKLKREAESQRDKGRCGRWQRGRAEAEKKCKQVKREEETSSGCRKTERVWWITLHLSDWSTTNPIFLPPTQDRDTSARVRVLRLFICCACSLKNLLLYLLYYTQIELSAVECDSLTQCWRWTPRCLVTPLLTL